MKVDWSAIIEKKRASATLSPAGLRIIDLTGVPAAILKAHDAKTDPEERERNRRLAAKFRRDAKRGRALAGMLERKGQPAQAARQFARLKQLLAKADELDP